MEGGEVPSKTRDRATGAGKRGDLKPATPPTTRKDKIAEVNDVDDTRETDYDMHDLLDLSIDSEPYDVNEDPAGAPPESEDESQ